MKSREIIEESNGSVLEALRLCGGYYECPKNADGKRLGPLVGYAGKYKDDSGDVYANFAKLDEYSNVLRYFAEEMRFHLGNLTNSFIFCGAPIGGYSFSQILGLAYDKRVIKAEKKVIALATDKRREQSKIIFKRYEIEPGDQVVIVEDVCNNFSTTKELIELIRTLLGEAVAIVCLFNRSPHNTYDGLPVISCSHKIIPEYKQDNATVFDDIAGGNVVWKPKDEWPRLVAAMEKIQK
jgi:orotate phosphoribosyltransferase